MPRTALIIAIALIIPVAALAEPGGARQTELLYMLKHDCGSCHGMTLKGGLGPPLLAADLAEKADADLTESIINGHPGTAMPPWGPLLGPGEAEWLVGVLKRGGATQ